MIRLPCCILVVVLTASGRLAVAQQRPTCASDNAGLTLPAEFCALVVADKVGAARHLAVAANGDVFVALRDSAGGVLALRDTSGDGIADVQRKFGPGPGSGIALHGGFLYFGTNDAVVRWPWRPGQLEPAGPPDTVVSGLTNRRQHAAKTFVIGADGALYVNIGAPSNACQTQDRTPGSPGQDPCPLLEIGGGIWRFDPTRLHQGQPDGLRFATGLRNTMALAVEPSSGALFGAQHGRDLLHGNWPSLFSEAQSAERPAEELVHVERGADYGWPYCYYDPELARLVLAPEYGGDGRSVGRCTAARAPDLAFPAHWAPDGMLFYSGTQYPAEYRGGLFIAFHGSWNRAPLPQQGYTVVFAPFMAGRPTGTHRVFLDGFAGERRDPSGAAHRPVGLAQGSDGSLYVSDDKGGRIYRVVYTGGR